MIHEQTENVKEEARGKKLDNDLKGLKTAISAATAAGAFVGGSALAYKNIKSMMPKKIDDGGWNALRSRSIPAASAKASRIGGLLRTGVGMFLPAVVGEAFDAIKRGYDANKHDNRKLERFVRQQFLGVH